MFAPVTQVLVEDADQRRKRCTRVILRILSPCASLHLQQASHLFLFRKLQTREVPGEPPLRYVGLSHAGCGSFWTYYRQSGSNFRAARSSMKPSLAPRNQRYRRSQRSQNSIGRTILLSFCWPTSTQSDNVACNLFCKGVIVVDAR